jgi:hypothetical protein
MAQAKKEKQCLSTQLPDDILDLSVPDNLHKLNIVEE